jgi:hypothetical protein
MISKALRPGTNSADEVPLPLNRGYQETLQCDPDPRERRRAERRHSKPKFPGIYFTSF